MSLLFKLSTNETDEYLLEKAADALGQLAAIGGQLAIDMIDFNVKLSLEWLQVLDVLVLLGSLGLFSFVPALEFFVAFVVFSPVCLVLLTACCSQGGPSERRKLAAVFVLKSLAEYTPSLFNVRHF